MKLIVCLDERNGMLFNNRRQSSDALVCRKILEISRGSWLWMNDYSYKLFPNENVQVSEDFLTQARTGDFCFVENSDVNSCQDKIEEIYVFRWNRVYPSDMRFADGLLTGEKTVLAEFPGKSHENITLEVYRR